MTTEPVLGGAQGTGLCDYHRQYSDHGEPSPCASDSLCPSSLFFAELLDRRYLEGIRGWDQA